MRMTIWRISAWEKLIPTVHQKRIGGRIANEILMMFRAGKKFSREVSIYDPIGADKDGETVSLLDVLEAGDREVLETVIIKQDVKILYEAYKENLTEMEQTVIRMRYGLFGTKEAHGKKYDVTFNSLLFTRWHHDWSATIGIRFPFYLFNLGTAHTIVFCPYKLVGSERPTALTPFLMA